MFCKNCNVKMQHVIRFEKGAMFEFERCPKCYSESKKVPYTIKTKTEQMKTQSRKKLSKK